MDSTMTAEGATWSAIGLLAVFAFSAAFTPGPNNMMLASSGATFGLRRTLPHALGVALGFPLMFFVVALGFESALVYAETQLAAVHPIFAHLRSALTVVAGIVMVWFGIRIALSGKKPPSDDARTDTAQSDIAQAEAALVGDAASRPLTFVEAAAFQWINPKAWAMAIGAANLYLVGEPPLTKALVGTSVFIFAAMTSAHSWAAFGAALRRILSNETRLRLFNMTMGVLVIASVAFIFA